MGNEIRVRDDQENLEQLVTTLQALEIGVSAYKSGKQAGWMIISAYLHQLLTDTSRGTTPLLKRVLPDLCFHPLCRNLAGSEDRYLLRVEAIIHPGTNFQDVFKVSTQVIPLTTWLEQVIYIQTYQDKGYPISIKQLILASRDQGGGSHFDPKVSLNLHLVEGMFSFIVGEGKPTFRDYLVIVGEYIHARVTYELMGALANGYREQGLFAKAREFLDTALANATTAGDIRSQCMQLQNLGLLSFRIGEYENAVRFYEAAIDINQSLADAETEQSILRNLATCWLSIGNQNYSTNDNARNKAIQAYERAIGCAQTSNDRVSQIVGCVNLADLHIGAAHVNDAMGSLVKSILLFWALEEDQQQTLEMRRAFTRAYRLLLQTQNDANFEQLIVEAINRVDNEYLGVESDVEKQDVVLDVKKAILETLAQISIEFPEPGMQDH